MATNRCPSFLRSGQSVSGLWLMMFMMLTGRLKTSAFMGSQPLWPSATRCKMTLPKSPSSSCSSTFVAFENIEARHCRNLVECFSSSVSRDTNYSYAVSWKIPAFRTSIAVPTVRRQSTLSKQTYHQTNTPPPKDDDWLVPKRVEIPDDALDFTYVRSSGAGGQNVNKVNTQAQARFHVLTASWIPMEVRLRLVEQQDNRINNDGYMVLSAQEHRTQPQNKAAVVDKLRRMVADAWPRPVERRVQVGLSDKAKQKRREFKRRRAEIKGARRSVNFDD